MAIGRARSRSPSLPPIKDPLKDDSDNNLDWYYNDPGGGSVLDFGKVRG
jgi:hypothetical protein